MIGNGSVLPLSWTKNVASRVLCTIGVDALFRAMNRRKVLILAYHGVTEAPLDPPCPWMVSELELARQLKWLSSRYRILRLDEVVARLRDGQPLPDCVAALTFDDGYTSVLRRALPILQSLRLPATVFLVTSTLDSPELLWHDQLYLALALSSATELDLSEDGGGHYDLGKQGLAREVLRPIAEFLKTLPVQEKAAVLESILRRLEVPPVPEADGKEFALFTAMEVREAAQSGWLSFGAHAHHHEILTRLDHDSQAREVRESMARIQRLLELPNVPFAYPNGQSGDFDDSVKELARESGLSCSVTAISGLNAAGEDLFALKRIVVEAGLPMWRFRLRTSGFTEWLRTSMPGQALSGAKRWRSRLRPLRRWMRNAVFKRQTTLIFERGPKEPRPAGTVDPRGRSFLFTMASRPDIDAFAAGLDHHEKSSFLNAAACRIDKGMRCFVIKRGEKVMSYVWADEGPYVHIAEVESILDIGAGALYLFDALTVPEWRGRNLFPHLLSQVCIAHPDRRMVIAASQSNRASRRAIEKAGFRPLQERRLLKVAGLVLRASPPRARRGTP